MPLNSPTFLETCSVSALKKLIKAEKTPKFDDIAADELTLWRVSIPVTEDDEDVPVLLEPLIDKKKLLPTKRLSIFFPEGASEDTVHMIVQRPPRVALAEIATNFFQPESEHTKFLKEFVMGIHVLPVTESEIKGLPKVGKQGPTKSRKAPTLLFFDLPTPGQSNGQLGMAEQILADNPGLRHLPLFGVSGCGKTRTTIELLSRTWGLYFNAGGKDLG
ncbi:hypothetical protein BGX26_004390, partial [Mortierella sp. AD094]